MQYLKPMELLHSQLRNAQALILLLFVLLGICLVAVPRLAALGNPIVVQTDAGARLASVQPWKASIARMEAFARAYLSARFDWNEENFPEKREALRSITEEAAFSKLKDSLSAFENLSKTQKVRSFYVLEQLRFSNGDETLRADLTRVLRVQSTALATPLSVTLTYRNAPITEQNPYGLEIISAQEVENETR